MRLRICAALVLVGCGHAAYPQPQLTDGDLVALRSMSPRLSEANDHYDKVIGWYRDAPVRVRVTCSDICPDTIQRTIELDVPPERCERAGGVLREHMINFGWGPKIRSTCVPKALVHGALNEPSD